MIGDAAVRRASEWCYHGIWGVVTRWMAVPANPPGLDGADDAHTQAFRPAEGYLQYLKFFFWIGLLAVDIALIIGWIVLLVVNPIVGIITAPIWWFVIVVPDIIAYVAIHLRYDTTWYVLSDRSMRIRRGIWEIHETTITYENIQNVSIRQGPIQRQFGISDVFVETAGGGGAVAGSHGAQGVGHHGLLEGVDNAEAIRDLIMLKWRVAKSAGLGDEGAHQSAFGPHSSAGGHDLIHADHLAVLKEIRDLAIRLAS